MLQNGFVIVCFSIFFFFFFFFFFFKKININEFILTIILDCYISSNVLYLFYIYKVHNGANKFLKKEIFDCEKVPERWPCYKCEEFKNTTRRFTENLKLENTIRIDNL